MFWPLRTQGTGTEESVVMGGWRGGMLLPKQRENWCVKNAAIDSLLVGLRDI
jgi:hypothetical protein